MSSKVAYQANAVHLEYATGSTWAPLRSSAVTLTQTYDESERGNLIPGVDALTFTISRWIDSYVEPLPEGSIIRLRYTQPGLDEIFRGVITDVTVNYIADPSAARHGHAWRADYQFTSTSLAASRLAKTITWKRLPIETVSARLSRWLTDVDLTGISDPPMPAETTAGSTTLLEMVRAAADYLTQPIRLVDTGTVTAIRVVTATSLPPGYTGTDALHMYARATRQNTAGDRAVSFDTDDATLTVTADLIDDDVRVLFSTWRIPEPLPAPFADPAPVTAFALTLTSTGCSGNLAFSYATPHRIKYRPPAPYVPNDRSSKAYVVAFTEISATTTDTDPTGPTNVLFPDINGGPGLPATVSATYDGTTTTVSLIPASSPPDQNAYYAFRFTWSDGTETSGGAGTITTGSGNYSFTEPGPLTALTKTPGSPYVFTGLRLYGGNTVAQLLASYPFTGTGGTPTYNHAYGQTYTLGTGHTLRLDNPRLNVDHMELDYTLTGTITGQDYLTIYQCHRNAPDGTGTGIRTTGSFADLEAGAPLTGTIGFSNGGGLYMGDTNPENYYAATVLREHEHGTYLSDLESVGPTGNSSTTTTYNLPTVKIDGEPMTVINFYLRDDNDPAQPPAIAAFELDGGIEDNDTLTFEGAEALTTTQAVGTPDRIENYLLLGNTTVAETIIMRGGDTVFAYASTVGITTPTITSSNPTACPLQPDQNGTTDATTFALSVATVTSSGAYVIAANADGPIVLSILVVTPQ